MVAVFIQLEPPKLRIQNSDPWETNWGRKKEEEKKNNKPFDLTKSVK